MAASLVNVRQLEEDAAALRVRVAACCSAGMTGTAALPLITRKLAVVVWCCCC